MEHLVFCEALARFVESCDGFVSFEAAVTAKGCPTNFIRCVTRGGGDWPDGEAGRGTDEGTDGWKEVVFVRN